jgi:hypothetical protein
MKNLFTIHLRHFSTLGFLLFFLLLSCQQKENNATKNTDSNQWVSIFNGKDLTGWTPKFAGYPVGENLNQTFSVEDGLLKVNYTEYDTFKNEFGHLFYKQVYSKFKMRLEYRFIGEQVKGGAGWAKRNNGIMFHAQSPESMLLGQGFPVSLEFQFLGGDGSGTKRTTGCLCTPGLHVIVADTLNKDHCIPNSGPTIDGDGWVKAELYADADQIMHHIINGDTVMTYRNPVIGGGFVPENYPVAEGTPVKEGYIALQAESAPIHFRNIEVMELK